MAKRHIIPLGKHKPVQSQMSGIVIRDDELPYGEKYSVYYTGQETAMIASYEKHKKMLDKRDAIAILDSLL
jgi:hypothetical protein